MTDATARWFAARQSATRDQASRHGSTWTTADIEFLEEFIEEPIEQVALALGRTYAAVMIMRHVLLTDGFQPAQTHRTAQAHAAFVAGPVCPVHFTELPATGRCDYC